MTLRFRPVLAVVMLIALAILISLGSWQLRRLEWKLGLINAVEERSTGEPVPFGPVADRAAAGEDVTYTAVELSGWFRHSDERHVFGAIDGQPGWFIFTPLQGEEEAVWVNRGFVPDALKQPAERIDGQIEGEVTVTGLMRMPEKPAGIAKMVAAPDNPDRNQWHIRDPAVFEIRGVRRDVYVDSFGTENPAGWPKGGTTRLDFTNRHLEYALTWFGLAAAMIGVFLAFSIRRKG